MYMSANSNILSWSGSSVYLLIRQIGIIHFNMDMSKENNAVFGDDSNKQTRW